MFLDSFFNNSWDSNNDFAVADFNQDFEAQAKLIDETIHSLNTRNLDTIDIAKKRITLDLGIVFKTISQTQTDLKSAIRNYSIKTNDAILKFHNRYATVQNTAYKAGLSNDITRIDYDGNAVAFIDSMLEAFDELSNELNVFSYEIENESGNLLATLNTTINEYQQNIETALANAENNISNAGNETRSLIATANTTFQQKITTDFANTLSSTMNKWLSSIGSFNGDAEYFVGELLGGALDIGDWF
jgi:hypothetical protein